MKHLSRNILLAAALVVASVASGAGVPTVNVTVADPSGKVAYKGKTSGTGTFATPALPPGEYVVQLNASANKSDQFAVVISSGKQKVVANDVNGSKFGGGGVAMKVKVGKGLNITGQIADASKVMASGNAKVKVMNGKRYFWVAGGGVGSNLGGRWVEEGSAEARQISHMSTEGVRNLQDQSRGSIGN
jgi:hypothetical protein